MNHLGEILEAKQYFEELQRVVAIVSYDVLDQIAATLLGVFESERTVYTFGNGGSAALASHLACECWPLPTTFPP